MSEGKEPSAADKLQAEYNQLVALYGHNKAQQMKLQEEERTLESRLMKTLHKASNLPKSDIQAAAQKAEAEHTKEEVHGTTETPAASE